jgi:hypothetical protein
MTRVRGVMAAARASMVGVGPRDHQLAAVVLGVERVLREERRHRQDLVAGVEHGLQHRIERRARSHGHDHVIGGVRKARLPAQALRHRLADSGVTGVGHVRMQVPRVAVEDAPGGGEHRRRRLDLRIAECEVEDLVGAPLLLEPRPLLEHAADPRGLL